MIQISTAKIVKQKFNLKRGFTMPTAIQKLENKYGIDSLLAINNETENIVKVIIEKLSDGFQLTDGFAAFSLISPLKTVGDNWAQAKLEYSDLIPTETATVLSDLTERGLKLAGLDLNDTGKRGIDDLMIVLTYVADLYDLINDKLADGYQPKDLESTPEVAHIMVKIFGHLEAVTLDVKDLSGREYSEAVHYLALRIHSALAKPRLQSA